MPPRKQQPKKPSKRQPELAFQAEVLALCDGRNLWPVVLNPERFVQRVACNQGFTDLMIAGPGGVIFRELKMTLMPGRGLSPSQVTWRDRLKSSGQNWGTWTPRDLRDGRVERELAEVETPRGDSNEWSLVMLGIPAAPRDGRGQDDNAEDDAAGSGKLERALPWLLAVGVITVVAGAIKSG